jgi:hypothetical protein
LWRSVSLLYRLQVPVVVIYHGVEDVLQALVLPFREFLWIEVFSERHTSVDVVPHTANLKNDVFDCVLSKLVFEFERTQQIELLRRLDKIEQSHVVGNLLILCRIVPVIASPDDEVGVHHRFKSTAKR